MPGRGTHGFRKYGRYRAVTAMSGLSGMAFSSRRLPMKHQGHTTSDTMSIVSAALGAVAGIRILLAVRPEDRVPDARGKPVSGSCRGDGRASVPSRGGRLPAWAATRPRPP